MSDERKVMITARLPDDLVKRVDFVAKNTDSEVIVSRSAAIRDALHAWLPKQEQRLVELGIISPKKAS